MNFLSRWMWVILLLLFPFFSFYASQLDSGVGHDKLKYLCIAWEMYQHGYSLVSILNDSIYVSKPPLLFWLITTFWHIFGTNLFAVQLFIDLCFITWGILLREIYGIIFPEDNIGKNSIPYLLLGSYIILRDVNFLRVDLLLVIGVLLSQYGIIKLIAQKSKGALVSIAIGSCIGLFSKGPIVFVFTLLPFLFGSIFSDSYRKYILKVTLAMLIGVSIFLLCWLTPLLVNQEIQFIQSIMHEQSNSRTLYHHQAVYLYFSDYLPILLLPWIINSIFLKKFFHSIKQFSVFNPFIVSVIITGLLVFSCYWQKTVWYILPVAMIILLYITRFLVVYQYEKNILRLNRYFFLCMYYLLGIACVVFIFFPLTQRVFFKNFPLPNYFSTGQLVVLAIIVVMTVLCSYKYKRSLLYLIYLFSCSLFLVTGIVKTEAAIVEERFTHLALVTYYLHQQEIQQTGLATYKNGGGYLNFSARLLKTMDRLSSTAQLNVWLQDHPFGMVLVGGNACPPIANLRVLTTYQETLKEAPISLCQQAN